MVESIQTQITPGQYLTRRNHFDSSRMAGTVPVWDFDIESQKVEPEITAKGRILPSRDIGAETAAGKPPSLSFGEFIDVINPLHHIPVVNNLYRQWTGDEISSVAKIIGGGIYGGPVGFAASIANAAVEEHSGKTMMGNVVANAFNSKSNISDIELGNKKMPSPSGQWHFNT